MALYVFIVGFVVLRLRFQLVREIFQKASEPCGNASMDAGQTLNLNLKFSLFAAKAITHVLTRSVQREQISCHAISKETTPCLAEQRGYLELS